MFSIYDIDPRAFGVGFVVVGTLIAFLITLLSQYQKASVTRSPLEGDELTLETERQGRRWGLMNRTKISDGKTVYIDRVSLITTPWFSVKFHRIFRPDQQRDLHDHPWSFLSIILRGHYVEDVPHHCGHQSCPFIGDPEPERRRWFNWKRAEDSHTIKWVSRSPVWTLVICGPVRRIWGFYAKTGWVAWNKYDKLDNP